MLATYGEDNRASVTGTESDANATARDSFNIFLIILPNKVDLSQTIAD